MRSAASWGSMGCLRQGWPWLLNVGLLSIGTAGIAGWLFIGLVHLRDRFEVGHVQGIWMALARYAVDGTLYPPLSDGVRFGGTRYMPLAILVNAGAARLTGEYLLSGKAVAIVLFAVLLVLIFRALRQMSCPSPLAVALAGLLPATNIGRVAGFATGGDVLPLVLQMGALMAMRAAVGRQVLGWTIGAGALAGFAVCSKLTAGWAALAVFGWLVLRRDWRRLAWFAAGSVSTVALTLGIVQWVSDGRFLANLLALAFAGTAGPGRWIPALEHMLFGMVDASAIWAVMPFAVLGVLATERSSIHSTYHQALWWSLLITFIVFADVGAARNHLLDVCVLTILAAGSLYSRLPVRPVGAVTLGTALALVVIWGGVSGLSGTAPHLRESMASLKTGRLPKYNPRPLASIVGAGDTLLAEDPAVSVLLGQTPVVLDPFMLRRVDELQPQAVDIFIARISRGEFDWVATINPLAEDDSWWRHYHFGLRVVSALRSSYVLVEKVDGYHVYRPRLSPRFHTTSRVSRTHEGLLTCTGTRP